jgi:O-antigen/teichoic acid export membrane protein
MLRFAQPCLNSPGLPEAVRFAIPAVPSQLIAGVGLTLDRLLLGSLTNLQTLGVYAVALRFAEVIGSLHSSFKMTFGPMMMKNITLGGRRGMELVVAVTPYYLIPYFAAGVGLTLFIGPLVEFIGRVEYAGVVQIVPWLAGIQILSSLYFYYCNGLFLGRRTSLLAIPATFQLVVLTVATLTLIGPLQTSGVILSRYAGAFSFFGLSLYLSQRVFRIEHQWGILLRLTAISIGFAAVGSLLAFDSLAIEVAAKAIAWLAFLVLAWWLVSGRRGFSDVVAALRLRPGVKPAVLPDRPPDGADPMEATVESRPTFD